MKACVSNGEGWGLWVSLDYLIPKGRRWEEKIIKQPKNGHVVNGASQYYYEDHWFWLTVCITMS